MSGLSRLPQPAACSGYPDPRPAVPGAFLHQLTWGTMEGKSLTAGGRESLGLGSWIFDPLFL